MPLSTKPSGPFGVLVVEDSADDEAMTLRGLRQCGLPINVTVARDGAEAVEMLTRKLDDLDLDNSPRLVLLDLKLPKIGGIEVLQAVRNSDRAGTMPVVCLTSSDEPSDTAACYAAGANSFVRKPLDFDGYLSVIAKTAEYWLAINYWPS